MITDIIKNYPGNIGLNKGLVKIRSLKDAEFLVTLVGLIIN